MISVTIVGSRHRFLSGGAAWASAVSFRWHLLPTWHQPRALWSSLRLLPYRLRDVVDSGITTTMSAWSQLATSPSTTSIAPSPPASAVQRVWDNHCCEVQADQLLDAAVDDVERARYLASRAPGSVDWLHTLPPSSIGITNGQRYCPHCCWSATWCSNRATTQMRIRTEVAINGYHGVSCRHGSGRYSRHNQVNEILCLAGAYATR